MTAAPDFALKIAEIKDCMEREEWAKAIHDLENIGPIPDKFLSIVSSILFYLYISRNQHGKLGRLSEKFEATKSKHALSALLLFRDRELGFPVDLPKSWKLADWEKAIEVHALAGRLEPKEIPLCLHFLSILNRPRLLEMLHELSVEAGGSLDDESVEIVLRCYLRNNETGKARRFLWNNNLNNVAFERFSFLIDRHEKPGTAIPESNDKFLTFLRNKFGASIPQPSFVG
jgi:hypothetical protein